MILHSVIVSYQRLELLKRTVDSYRATVSVPHRLVIVDNGSDMEVRRWIDENVNVENVRMLGENRYPGFACNRGFEWAAGEVTHLHRSDSDMLYLDGWCEAVLAGFDRERTRQDAPYAIVGLRTDAEELHTALNTGGTAVIDRKAWDAGLRYVETPWVDDMTEDWRICQDARKLGWDWTRVRRPCVIHLGGLDASAADPYYQHSFGVRGISRLLEEHG